MKARMLFAIVAMCLFILPAVMMAQAQESIMTYAGVVPRNASYEGLTYSEWANEWQKWAAMLPATNHPLMNTSDCSSGQSGPVWFLGGLFCANGQQCDFANVQRSCVIPKGKALFFPILNAEDSFIEDLKGSTEAYLRQQVYQWTQSDTNMWVLVDGVPIGNISSFRICSLSASAAGTCSAAQAPLFSYRLAAHDNLYAAIGETLNLGKELMPDDIATEGVTDGYYILLKPMLPGLHTIHFHGESGYFVLDVTYHVRVLN